MDGQGKCRLIPITYTDLHTSERIAGFSCVMTIEDLLSLRKLIDDILSLRGV